MSILNKNFTFIDLFAGIGGFHYAMKKYSNKATCVFASEINKNAIAVYKKNHNIDSDKNIVEARASDIPNFDVVCAGFPCQSFSKAGSQLGFNDDRGVLFNEIERLIKEKIEQGHKPRVLILENVKNLVTHDNHKTWKIIKVKLEGLGYNILDKPLVVSPFDFGIPQIRERAIILGIDKDIYDKKITFEVKKELIKNSIDSILQEDKNIDLPKYKIQKDKELILEAWDSFIKIFDKKTMGFPIWSDYFYSEFDDHHAPKWKKEFVRKNKELYNNNKNAIDSWYKQYKIHDFAPTHRKFEWQAGDDIQSVFEGIIQFRTSGIRVKRPTTSPTLVAMNHIPIIGFKRRYITEREAANLQSFPKEFDYSGVGTDIYRLLGNAVNVEVIYRVFRDFIKYIDEEVSK